MKQTDTEWHAELVLAALGPRPSTKSFLSLRTGLPERSIEAAVQHIRREALANVASNGDGYWLATTTEELEADIERGERRIRTMLATRRGQKRLLRQLKDTEAYRATLWGEP